ncbi:hypothetical protein G9A89_022424 [Geosiphon pyriformis]|nr:hypothetical protein G9A89_022424 [Geosiphon pyriformis]
MDFNAFKLVFLQYFSNNNSINRLVNIFTTIKQEENEAVIQTDYFTVPQILNQFIRGLCSSILQCIHPIHPADFQATVMNVRDFEAAKLETNHKMRIVSKISCVYHHYSINCDSQRCEFATTVSSNPESLLKLRTISVHLSVNNTADNILTTHISTSSLLITATSNISTIAATNNLLDTHRNSRLRVTQNWRSAIVNLGTGHAQNPIFQHYLSLLVTPENTQPNKPETNQQSTLTSNIPPAIITKNELLDVIFLFELEELSTMLLFSGAVLEEKPITTMYTDAKVDGHSIKLILNSRSIGSIITKQLMDQLGHRVD